MENKYKQKVIFDEFNLREIFFTTLSIRVTILYYENIDFTPIQFCLHAAVQYLHTEQISSDYNFQLNYSV